MSNAKFALCSLIALALLGSPALAERRVALAIGESAYSNVPTLTNPARDATAMADLFRSAGFDDVQLAVNYKVSELRKALRAFADVAASADMAVVYYAGHGVEIGGKNYLVPVDARLLADLDVDDEAIDLDYVLTRIEPAKRLKLVILDSCRENPFKTKAKTRAVGRGLKAPDGAVSDTLIAFAAQPGALAADGDGEHSPFTAALLKHLAAPGVELDKALRLVRDDVLRSSGRRQEPWSNGSRGAEDVYFGGPSSAAPGSDAEFAVAMQAGTIAAFEEFLRRNPSGPLASAARAELERLRRAAGSPDAQPQPQKPGGSSWGSLLGKQPSSQSQIAALPPEPPALQSPRAPSFDVDLDALLTRYPAFPFTATVKEEREKLREIGSSAKAPQVRAHSQWIEKALKADTDVFCELLGATYFAERDVLELSASIGNGGSEPIRVGEFRTTSEFRFLNPTVYTTAPDYPAALMNSQGVAIDDSVDILGPGEKKTKKINVSGYGRVIDYVIQNKGAKVEDLSGNLTLFSPSGVAFACRVSGKLNIEPMQAYRPGLPANAAKSLGNTRYSAFEADLNAFLSNHPAAPLTNLMTREAQKLQQAVASLDDDIVDRYLAGLKKTLPDSKFSVNLIGAKFLTDKDLLKLSVKVKNQADEPVKIGEFVFGKFRFINHDVFTQTIHYPELIFEQPGLVVSDDSPLFQGKSRIYTLIVSRFDYKTGLKAIGGDSAVTNEIEGTLSFFTPSGNRIVVKIGGKLAQE